MNSKYIISFLLIFVGMQSFEMHAAEYQTQIDWEAWSAKKRELQKVKTLINMPDFNTREHIQHANAILSHCLDNDQARTKAVRAGLLINGDHVPETCPLNAVVAKYCRVASQQSIPLIYGNSKCVSIPEDIAIKMYDHPAYLDAVFFIKQFYKGNTLKQCCSKCIDDNQIPWILWHDIKTPIESNKGKPC